MNSCSYFFVVIMAFLSLLYFCFVELNHGHVVALCYSDLHLLTACLSFVFGIFSFVDDIRVTSMISNNLSKVCRLLSDPGILKLVNTAQVS